MSMSDSIHRASREHGTSKDVHHFSLAGGDIKRNNIGLDFEMHRTHMVEEADTRRDFDLLLKPGGR